MSHHYTRLASGLTIVSEHVAEAASITLNIGVNVGSRHEQQHQLGLAHFLEHMAFKGTKKRSAQRIAEEFDDIGGYLNAYTDREQTVYTARILEEYVDQAIDILADIIQNSQFDPVEIARERQVIEQEIAQSHDTPDDIVFDILQDVIYPNQSLGKPILGNVASIEAFATHDFHQFMADHYHPNRMVVSAAGAVHHDEFVSKISKLMDHLPGQENASLPCVLSAHYTGGQRVVTRPELEQVQALCAFPGISCHDEHYYALQMLVLILGGGMSSRLFQEIREKRGLVYSIYSYISSYQDTGMIGIYSGCSADSVDSLIPAIKEVLNQLMDKGPNEAEMARARTQMRSGLLMAQESSSFKADELVRNYLTYGRHIGYDEIWDKIRQIDVRRLQDTAERFFTNPSSWVLLGPVKSNKLDNIDKFNINKVSS
jgi:predicted Zn-dependent peptidase